MRRISADDFARRKNAALRQAFTLVELMIAIAIIAILMGLLLPAVTSAFRSARVAQVVTEIRGLEAAIAQFKNVYGVEPPSRIRLYETASGSPSWSTHSGTFLEPVTGATVSNDAERVRSLAFVNRMWPNYDFSINRDIDGDGSTSGFVSLTGAECLVFFLGGRPIAGPNGAYAMTGFSKNPSNPLLAAAGNESREGPFFEFKPSRLRQSPSTTIAGILVYMDPLPSQTSPYTYASSSDGRGYQRADLYVGPNVPPTNWLNDVYRTGAGFTAVAQKNKSFQIISPGADATYGSGGFFDATAANHGLTNKFDRDNISNFHSGLLSE